MKLLDNLFLLKLYALFCCYILIKGCSLRLAGPNSSCLRLSFQFILLKIVSNSDFINIKLT